MLGTGLKAMLYYVDDVRHNKIALEKFNLKEHNTSNSQGAMVGYIKKAIVNDGHWATLSTNIASIRVSEENKDIIISARLLNFINLEKCIKAYVVYSEADGKFKPLYVRILKNPIYFSSKDNIDGISFAIKESYKDSIAFKYV